MDKNAIRKYAVWARRELIERVSQKAALYGITDNKPAERTLTDINGTPLTATQQSQRGALVARIREHGYEHTMEEVAYTWFNRFCAIRFMEVNGYLPSHVRVLSDDAGAFHPQILTEAINLELDGLDMDKVYTLKEANDNEALFRYLLIVQCNALSAILPGMFQKIADYTELLLPDYLLREGSVLERLITDLPENSDDPEKKDMWTDQVQIIGWLYQYYNSEPKDKVFADLKKNIKISKESIPAATQLFTPDWIVRYMVENSLGRLWVEGHPNNELKSTWKYYLEEAEQEPEVQAQLATIRAGYAQLKPEDLLCIDPCMGSGHILCYMFDVLVQIYEAYGYTAREAAVSIVENNLWGLDIDDRAAQLAYFAVMMKARQYDRRFLTRGIQPHVMAIQESNGMDATLLMDLPAAQQRAARMLMETFHDAKEYGSILTMKDTLMAALTELPEDAFAASMYGDDLRVLALQAKALGQKYDVVVTNPPYAAVSGLADTVGKFIKDNYPDSKSDLFAVFIERIREMLAVNGYQAMITQHAWMFLSSFENLRKKLMQIDTVNMAHLGARAFEEIGGEVVQTTAFVLRSGKVDAFKGTYFRLIEPTTQQGKEDMFLRGENRYVAQQDNFAKIPGMPVAYWVTTKAMDAYSYPNLDSIAQPRHGLATSDNDRFLKLWPEVDITKTSIIEKCDLSKKWFPMNKGGSYRRWYGNLEWIINYENDGKEIKDFAISIYRCSSRTIQNTQFYFKKSITWSALTSGLFSVRWSDRGALFGSGGYCAFVDDKLEWYITALLNNKVAGMYLALVSSTMNFEVGHIKTIPVIIDTDLRPRIDLLTQENITLSKADWDSFETSWDFQRHPLFQALLDEYNYCGSAPWMTLKDCYHAWEEKCTERFNHLKANEEELNRIFIDIYGLQDELTPDVADKDVTVRRADLQRDIKSLISYAVGCMLGRYSLDKPGLNYAGGEWALNEAATYPADRDGILPITDDDYFDDDIVGMFVKFIETVYGKATLEENLRFIADALGGTGTSREVIRSYFLNDFYKDHCTTYSVTGNGKRPIYWLFDAGKKNSFKCLIYMHRYRKDTIARIRTDYVHETQSRYRTAIEDVEKRLASASTAERVKLNKQLKKLQEQAEELRRYEEKIHHLADMMIEIDLDDGVKVNYEKFKDVLAQIK